MAKRLLDAAGRPLARSRMNGDREHGLAVLKEVTSIATARHGLIIPAAQKASDPFASNPWVFACAFAVALNGSQSMLTVYEEDEPTQEARRKAAVARGTWQGVFPSGGRRRGVERYRRAPGRSLGIVPRGLSPLPDHPLTSVLLRPNSLMGSQQFWFLAYLWLVLKNEAFFLCVDADGKPVSWRSGAVAALWPVSPGFVSEIIEENRLTGWRVVTDYGMGIGAAGRGEPFMLDEVVHVYLPDPYYPIRGLNPFRAAATELYIDAAATNHNANLLQQGGIPAGILVHDGPQRPFKNKDEEEEFRQKWAQRHGGGSDRARTVAMLTGSWKYVEIGLTPKDMDYLQLRTWDRDTVLAILSTPKSVLSITEHANYATHLAQDRNLWDKNLLPKQELIESTFDATLFYAEPDTVFAMFDNARVESLKVGVADKLNAMNVACGATIHMPPDVAAKVVGLDVPSFDGDDMALLPAGLVTVDEPMAGTSGSGGGGPAAFPPGLPGTGSKPPPFPPGHPPGPAGMPPAPDGSTPPHPPTESPEKTPAGRGDESRIDKSGAAWYNPGGARLHGGATVESTSKKARPDAWRRAMRLVMIPYEARYKRAWRRFVGKAKERGLRAFDARRRDIGYDSIFAVTRAGDALFDLDPKELEKLLGQEFRPIYAEEVSDTLAMTAEELGGMNVFSVDDEEFFAAVERRQSVLLDSAPDTLLGAVQESVAQGSQDGETIEQLRLRVAEVFDVSASSAKALTVARTEAAGLMNDVRETAFQKAGFEKRSWTTAEDEHVRADHKELGRQPPQPAGTNWLELIGEEEEGVLEFPGDSRAPAGQVINCRCVMVPE